MQLIERDKYKIKATRMVQRWILSQLDNFEQYSIFIKGILKAEINKIDKNIEEITRNLTEEEKERYIEFFSEDKYIIKNIFSKTITNSSIVSLFSFIEVSLNNLCDAAKQDLNVTLSYRDMRDRHIRRSRLYLEKVIQINLHTNDRPWKEIFALSKIRNEIVHGDLIYTDELKNDKIIKNHIKLNKIELLNTADKKLKRFELKNDYFHILIQFTKAFFDEIHF